MEARTANRIRLAAAAVLFSTGGAAIKAVSFAAWQVATLRSGLAALVIVALLPAARQRPTPRVLAVAAVYAATMVLFVLANKTTTAANAIFFQAAAPVYLIVLAPLLLKERVRGADLTAMAVIGLGLVLVIRADASVSATAPNPALGNLLGALSGVCWAFTLTGLRWLGASDDAGRATLATVVWGNAIAALACLPFALPFGPASPADLALIAYLGVFQIGLAYVFVARGITGVPALEASILLLIEPALNPVWAWLVNGEVPAAQALAGGALILGASVVRARSSVTSR